MGKGHFNEPSAPERSSSSGLNAKQEHPQLLSSKLHTISGGSTAKAFLVFHTAVKLKRGWRVLLLFCLFFLVFLGVHFFHAPLWFFFPPNPTSKERYIQAIKCSRKIQIADLVGCGFGLDPPMHFKEKPQKREIYVLKKKPNYY